MELQRSAHVCIAQYLAYKRCHEINHAIVTHDDKNDVIRCQVLLNFSASSNRFRLAVKNILDVVPTFSVFFGGGVGLTPNFRVNGSTDSNDF